jgi:hypothetical protein
MSESTNNPESPLLWPALVLFVIAVAAYTWYWDTHRHVFHAKTGDAMEQVETTPK